MESWNRGVISPLELRTAFGRYTYILFIVLLLILAVTVLFPFVFAFAAGLKTSTDIIKGGLKISRKSRSGQTTPMFGRNTILFVSLPIPSRL